MNLVVILCAISHATDGRNLVRFGTLRRPTGFRKFSGREAMLQVSAKRFPDPRMSFDFGVKL